MHAGLQIQLRNIYSTMRYRWKGCASLYVLQWHIDGCHLERSCRMTIMEPPSAETRDATSDETVTFTEDDPSSDPLTSDDGSEIETVTSDDSFTSDSVAPPTGGDAESDQGGMNAGEIAGIVIGILICLALIILVVILLLRRKKEKSEEPDEGEMTEENITETKTSSFATYEMGNNEITEDNPIFVNDQDGESEFNAFEEHWI